MRGGPTFSTNIFPQMAFVTSRRRLQYSSVQSVIPLTMVVVVVVVVVIIIIIISSSSSREMCVSLEPIFLMVCGVVCLTKRK
jgi:uncharacterized membrane-anchored protein